MTKFLLVAFNAAKSSVAIKSRASGKFTIAVDDKSFEAELPFVREVLQFKLMEMACLFPGIKVSFQHETAPPLEFLANGDAGMKALLEFIAPEANIRVLTTDNVDLALSLTSSSMEQMKVFKSGKEDFTGGVELRELVQSGLKYFGQRPRPSRKVERAGLVASRLSYFGAMGCEHPEATVESGSEHVLPGLLACLHIKSDKWVDDVRYHVVDLLK